MSVSIIQTRKAKGKDHTPVDVDRVEEEGEVGDHAAGDVESKIVQVVVQEEHQEDAGAVPAQVEAKQDSHVQIIASGSVIVFVGDFHLVSHHFNLAFIHLSLCLFWAL